MAGAYFIIIMLMLFTYVVLTGIYTNLKTFDLKFYTILVISLFNMFDKNFLRTYKNSTKPIS